MRPDGNYRLTLTRSANATCVSTSRFSKVRPAGVSLVNMVRSIRCRGCQGDRPLASLQPGKPEDAVGVPPVDDPYPPTSREGGVRPFGSVGPGGPPQLLERAQPTLAANGGKRSRPQECYSFTLDGLVRCGSCGAHMTPYFTYNHQKKLYAYYTCTNRNHRGPDACSMANVPAAPLEQVIADRLIQLSRQDRTVDRLVKDAMADTSELLGNLADRRTTLCASRKWVQDQIDALVEGIANRRTALKSVSEKIVELEEQKEQLEDEILEVGMEIETAKQKAVSAQSLTESLTTFGDLYREALPEERRELIRLRVNQLIWTPDEIRLALLDQLEACQELVESQHLVARTLDSTNSGVVWDKFHIYQGHRAYIQIGTKRKNPVREASQRHQAGPPLQGVAGFRAGGLSGRISATLRHPPHHGFGLPASPRVG